MESPMGASFVIANLFSLYLTADPWLTVDTALIAVGCGCFFLSTRWLGATLTAILISWAWVAGSVLPQDRMGTYSSPVAASMILSFIIHVIRRRSAAGLETLRGRELQQRQELQTALAAAEEGKARFRELVDTSPMGIVVHVDDVIVFANPKAVELAGGRGQADMFGRSARLNALNR